MPLLSIRLEAGPGVRAVEDKAVYKSKRLLDYVTITCANKRVGWFKNGTAQVETKCD